MVRVGFVLGALRIWGIGVDIAYGLFRLYDLTLHIAYLGYRT